jgi:hypothetical protein
MPPPKVDKSLRCPCWWVEIAVFFWRSPLLTQAVYLGDRACKKIEIDGWNEMIKIQVDEISRIRSSTGQWEFYNQENIQNGYIVFSDIKSFAFDPAGYLPNDEIELSSVEIISNDRYRFVVKLASCNERSEYQKITLTIECGGIYLEDPQKPNVKIVD